ncbi:unnamed protein product [Peniophora sp. CBMAI 1063]|nr:unnamed protein product [Peniophora sp. CBMAI 1063]
MADTHLQNIIPFSDTTKLHIVYNEYLAELAHVGANCLDTDPEGVASTIAYFCDAYRQVKSARGDIEARLRTGTDLLVDFALGTFGHQLVPGSGAKCEGRTEAQFWIPPSENGPNRIPRTDMALVFFIELDRNLEVHEVKLLEETWFFNDPWWEDPLMIGFAAGFVEHKREEQVKTAVNQILMDLVSSARFTYFIGLRDLPIWGCVVTERAFTIFRTKPTPPNEKIDIYRYESWPIRTFSDYMKLYFFFADVRNSTLEFLANRKLNTDDIPFNPNDTWRTGHDAIVGDGDRTGPGGNVGGGGTGGGNGGSAGHSGNAGGGGNSQDAARDDGEDYVDFGEDDGGNGEVSDGTASRRSPALATPADGVYSLNSNIVAPKPVAAKPVTPLVHGLFTNQGDLSFTVSKGHALDDLDIGVSASEFLD